MSNTDFFDDDLEEHRHRVRRDEPDPEEGAVGDASPGAGGPVLSKGAPDSTPSRMALQKEEVGNQVAHAAEELERLRQRQHQLEREKRALEEVRRRQEEYEQIKREMVDHLNRSLLVLEKDEIRTGQLLELLGSTRQRFRSMLDEIKVLNEEEWAQDHFSEELGKGLARLEDMRIDYKKSMARIQSVSEQEGSSAEDKLPVFDESLAGSPAAWGFLWWMKAGLAFSLPIAALAVLLMLVVLTLRNLGWM